MTKDETEAVIRDLFEARKQNKAPLLERFFTEDATYGISGCAEHSPLCGSMEGRDAYMGALASLTETFAWDDVDIHDIIVEGDRAAVFYTLTVRHIPSGAAISTVVADRVVFRGDRIVSFIEHIDTARANALVA